MPQVAGGEPGEAAMKQLLADGSAWWSHAFLSSDGPEEVLPVPLMDFKPCSLAPMSIDRSMLLIRFPCFEHMLDWKKKFGRGIINISGDNNRYSRSNNSLQWASLCSKFEKRFRQFIIELAIKSRSSLNQFSGHTKWMNEENRLCLCQHLRRYFTHERAYQSHAKLYICLLIGLQFTLTST